MGLALDELKEEEETVRINELDVLMEELVRPFVAGQILDYISDQNSSGFVFASDSQEECC